MITVPFTGQWGNQAFNFVLAKILAEKYQQDYIPPTPYWQTKNGQPVRYSSPTPFIAQPKPTYGRAVAGPTQHVRSPHWVNMDGFDRDRPIHVETYAQRYEIFQPYKERIHNEWLKIDPEAFGKTDPERVYIHVRRTDYVGDNLNPDQQCIAHTIPEYLQCLEEFPEAKTATIVTDDPHDPFVASLRVTVADKLKGECFSVSCSWDRDFMLLASAKNLIISQSTFSWWAALLGRAEKIVCPISPTSLWGRGRGLIGPPKGTDYPNLEVTDDPQWKWVTT